MHVVCFVGDELRTKYRDAYYCFADGGPPSEADTVASGQHVFW